MDKTHPSNVKCSFLDVNLEQTKDTFTASILTCILNAVFSLLTVSGNFIILRVIWKTQELHSPSFVLLFCLAAADFLVGFICQPFFVAYQIAEITNNYSAYCILRMIQNISGWITTGVSFGTLSSISVDRLLALTLHLRYNTIVSVQRILQTVFMFWIVSVTVVMLRFWIHPWIIFPVVVAVASFFVTTLSTLRIFQIVRKHQRQISQQEQSVQNNTVNVLKCRKSAVTVLYVYGLFVILYLPFCATMFVETFTGYTLAVKIAYDYVTTVVFINSFLNPIVYCWRIGEIRRAVKSSLKKNWRAKKRIHWTLIIKLRRPQKYWINKTSNDWSFSTLFEECRCRWMHTSLVRHIYDDRCQDFQDLCKLHKLYLSFSNLQVTFQLMGCEFSKIWWKVVSFLIGEYVGEESFSRESSYFLEMSHSYWNQFETKVYIGNFSLCYPFSILLQPFVTILYCCRSLWSKSVETRKKLAVAAFRMSWFFPAISEELQQFQAQHWNPKFTTFLKLLRKEL